MCMGSSAPTPPAPPPPPPPAPTVNEVEVQNARERERRRVLSSQGMRSTILTSPLGDTSQAPTSGKALLGA